MSTVEARNAPTTIVESRWEVLYPGIDFKAVWEKGISRGIESVLKRRVESPQDDDVVSDAFFVFFQRTKTLQPRRPIALARKIARAVAVDHVRARDRLRLDVREIEDLADAGSPSPLVLLMAAETPSILDGMRAHIVSCLGRLAWDVFVDRERGLTWQVITEQRGLTRYRARKLNDGVREYCARFRSDLNNR